MTTSTRKSLTSVIYDHMTSVVIKSKAGRSKVLIFTLSDTFEFESTEDKA